ncbi:KorB domain-containing protein [Caballeronia sp. GaOx3]|uniref:KorB domain-containing protein n=1 Tax=Caballeronia sp. GaOx3 TaxID=2921740 RepID=UPI003917DC33
MQSVLIDYEKYVGLKRFQQKHANLKQAEIAGRIGISQSYVSLLLSYDRLPNAARAVLEANVVCSCHRVRPANLIAERNASASSAVSSANMEA